MLKWEFEKKLKEEFSELKISSDMEAGREIMKYDFGPQEHPVVLEDQGLDGIRIAFYNKAVGRQQELYRIYHWADAYQILYLALLKPEKLASGDGTDVNVLLEREPFPFKWEGRQRDIDDFDDITLQYALELVKYGLVKGLSYDTVNERAIIKSYQAACAESDSVDVGRATLLKVLKDIDSGTLSPENVKETKLGWRNKTSFWSACNKKTCKEQICLLSFCGFLEYELTNGMLANILSEREQKRAEYRLPSGPYEFTWKPQHGLREVPENMFQLALQMVRNGVVRVDEKLNQNNQVCIRYADCITEIQKNKKEVTTCAIAEVVSMKKNNNDLKEFWAKHISVGLDSVLQGSLPVSCVYFYAAYIQYLQNCGWQHIIDEDRAFFEDNRSVVEQKTKCEFSNKLPVDLFMDTPDDFFEVAELLQERNYVSLCKNISRDNNNAYFCICISSALRDIDFLQLKQVKQAILEEKIARHPTEIRRFPVGGRFDDWKSEAMHYGLAAYIDYLCKTGQYETYKKDRLEHKESTAAQFADMQAEDPAFEKVLAIAKNEKDSSLYCFIEGDRAVGKHEYINQIAMALAQGGKIDSPTPIEFSFERMAAFVGYRASNKFSEGKSKGILPLDSFMVYETFDKSFSKKLIVLNNLEEFLYKLENVSKSDRFREEHLIRLLGTYQRQTYIIVLGDASIRGRFLDLSPQIKFLFGDNVISITNWDTDKLYKAFREKLSDDLREKAEQNDDFKERFSDYLAMNRKFLPLKNQKLAEYLADFANTRKSLDVPLDVYRSQPAKEKLQAVIGMENIKKATNEFEKYAIFLRRAQMNGMDLSGNSMHMLFTGGPGTGKTMIARIMAEMLFDLEIIPEQKFKEVEAKDLIHPYVGESGIKTGQIIEEAIGGVLFIDEAYAIGDRISAKEVIAALMKAMEDHKNDLVIIFAGYEKEMHDFLNINPGLSSRIGYTYHFSDYTVDELVQMFDTKMRRVGFEYENDEILPEVRKLCEYFKGKKNFGNGRFIDQVMRDVILAHSQSGVSNDKIRTLSAQDVPSIYEMASTDITVSQDYEEQLDAFIGMENVKHKVRELAKFVTFQQQIENHGGKISSGNMHMVFTGNPGTGKTTIARIMADMLFSIGIIKTNKIIEVERKDLVAEHVGQTAGKTADVIDRAMDGILFIDEAYTLASASNNDYGSEAIATLIKAMEDHKNDLIVIFAGYQDEMRDFINANPGIESRIWHVFEFEDYTPDELTEMLQMKMKESGLDIEEKALDKARIVFEYFAKRKNFGNGRFVNKLMQEILMRRSSRMTDTDAVADIEEGALDDADTNERVNTSMEIGGDNVPAAGKPSLLVIQAEDIPDIADMTDTVKRPKVDDQLDSIVGMQAVKDRLQEFEKFIKFEALARDHGLEIPNFNMHMVFTGNSGTGKTSIARIIAERLYSIGVIKENKLIEVERKDLVAEHIGQTAVKTAEVIERAMGGILFIDEAYALAMSDSARDFGPEAIATLIKAMEDYKDNFIVIFAGYKAEMEKFIHSNPGLESRIGFSFEFEDYSAEELTEIFFRKMQSHGFTVQENAKDKLAELMGRVAKAENFGNGRFVDQVIQKTLMNHAGHYDVENIGVITPEDIPDADEMDELSKRAQHTIGFAP